jgi:hypothetical protein
MPAGTLFTVHLPDDGSPFSTTLPSGFEHVGAVMVPVAGICGVGGWAFITILAEARDAHPPTPVTVKLYVPGASAGIMVLVPEPETETVPGYRISVQGPAGRPLRVMLPVGTIQEGWTIFPASGGDGTGGCAFIWTGADGAEIQPLTETMNVYVPLSSPEMVTDEPLPVVVTLPGLRTSIQLPDPGNPFKTTDPVEEVHVGCVTLPGTGDAGTGLTVSI